MEVDAVAKIVAEGEEEYKENEYDDDMDKETLAVREGVGDKANNKEAKWIRIPKFRATAKERALERIYVSRARKLRSKSWIAAARVLRNPNLQRRRQKKRKLYKRRPKAQRGALKN